MRISTSLMLAPVLDPDLFTLKRIQITIALLATYVPGNELMW